MQNSNQKPNQADAKTDGKNKPDAQGPANKPKSEDGAKAE